jgi:hypothetical protein
MSIGSSVLSGRRKLEMYSELTLCSVFNVEDNMTGPEEEDL